MVFDLDNLMWSPEMYHLWGGGGAPFEALPNGNVADRSATEVVLMGNIREVLVELHTAEEWEQTHVCVASTCDEPNWAFECMDKMVINGKRLVEYIDAKEVHKGDKAGHFRSISRALGVDFSEMIFFDDQHYNLETVSKLGVTTYFVPEGGVTREVWEKMLATFPSPGAIIRC